MNSVDETLDDLMAYLKEDDSKAQGLFEAKKFVERYLNEWDSSNAIDVVIVSLLAEFIQSFMFEAKKSFEISNTGVLLFPEALAISVRALNDVIQDVIQIVSEIK